jgi:hypothetical protein
MQAIHDDEMEDEDGSQTIIDEEELGMLNRMKELKKVYRNAYEALKAKKHQINLI